MHLQSFARELLEAVGAGGRLPGAEGPRSGSRCPGSPAASGHLTVPLTPLPASGLLRAAAGRREAWQQVGEPSNRCPHHRTPHEGATLSGFQETAWMPLGLGTRVDTSCPRGAQRHCPPPRPRCHRSAGISWHPWCPDGHFPRNSESGRWGVRVSGKGVPLATCSLKLSARRSQVQLRRVCFPPVVHAGESRRRL